VNAVTTLHSEKQAELMDMAERDLARSREVEIMNVCVNAALESGGENSSTHERSADPTTWTDFIISRD
jgi:hypothetical protein